MADKTILFDFDNDYRIDSSGIRKTDNVYLGYEETPSWELQIRTVSDSTLSSVDLSTATTWAAAVDDDFDHDSDPMCRTLDADIDSSDSANGNIVVELDADTSTFETAIGTSRNKNCWFAVTN